MTPAEKAAFIELWTQGIDTREIGRLGLPRGTVGSRAATLVCQVTVWLSKALIEHIQTVAYERRMPPANYWKNSSGQP